MTQVGTIYDQSGADFNFSSISIATCPTYATAGPNNRPCADFDGVDDYMDTAAALANFITAGNAYVVISVIIDAVTLDDATPQNNHCVVGDAAKHFGVYARNQNQLTLYGVNN